VWLLVIAVPIACVTWTITHEEVFREPCEYCQRKSTSRNICKRKIFYVLTCEYCLSHWIAAAFLLITRYKLLFDDWRGYLLALFSLVWVAKAFTIAFGWTSNTSTRQSRWTRRNCILRSRLPDHAGLDGCSYKRFHHVSSLLPHHQRSPMVAVF
jgi:hypothetical protein